MSKLRPPPYAPFPALAAGELSLRQLHADDAEAVMEICYYDGEPARTVDQARQMLEQIDLDYQRGETVHWGIEIAGGIAGTCGFYRGFAAAAGEVGYVLRADFRGRGIMTAAMRPVLAFGFEHIGLRTINAFTDHDNLASQAVLTRLGFRLETDSPAAETLRFVLSTADAPRTAR